MIEIPLERLDNETLFAIAESYILREGTDYGINELSLERKVSQVVSQVKRGEIVITFDDAEQSCNLMPRQEWLKWLKTNRQ